MSPCKRLLNGVQAPFHPLSYMCMQNLRGSCPDLIFIYPCCMLGYACITHESHITHWHAADHHCPVSFCPDHMKYQVIALSSSTA